jgi:putative ABC transport system permease protein
MARQGGLLDGILHDVAAALRLLGRRPGFSALAAGTLALGLATSTAVFTYVGAYSAPIPGANADGLYQVWLASEGEPWGQLSYPDFLDLREAAEGGVQVVGYRPGFLASVRHETLTEVVPGEAVTGRLFEALEIPVAMGRGLTAADDRPASAPATVISHAYWTQRYQGSTDVIGRTLVLNGRPHTIVGVAAESFLGLSSSRRPGFWLPFSQFMPVYWARSDNETNREVGSVQAFVRLSPGVSPADARARIDAHAAALDVEAPLADRARRFLLTRATWIHPATRDAEAATARIMLLAAAGLLLLACSNVANLLLSAGARRHREVAVRSALGAPRRRLVRQLLVENAVLTFGAFGVAVLLAEPAARRLSEYFARPSVWGTNVPRWIELDPRVVLFAAGAALVSGLATSLVPALRLYGRDIAGVLRGGAGATAGPVRVGLARYLGLQDGLVALQLGLSVVLIFVASLVVRTLATASSVDLGFSTRGTLASYVSTSSMGVATEDRHAFFGSLIERLEDLEWIEAATVSENAPLSPHPRLALTADAAGEAPPVATSVSRVWPGYFELLELELRAGRALERTDTAYAPDVVVVNEALGRAVFGTADAVGSTLFTPAADSGDVRAYEVVGVVRDTHLTSVLDAVEPAAYFSLLQHYSAPGNGLVVRVSGPPAAQVDRLERALRDVDPRIAIVNILPYEDVIDGFLYVQRMNAELFALVAAFGMGLAGAGLFSVVALSVAGRRREIGVRMAVGAAPPEIVGLVLARVALPLAAGTIGGAAVSWVVAGPVKSLLWNTSAADPVALVSGASIVAAAVAAAVAVPVHRALGVDPAATLKSE